MLRAESVLDPLHRTFLEYALPCNIAFHRTEKLDLTAGLAEAASRFRYRQVFILDPLPWQSDAERVEGEEYQQAVHRHMHDVYAELGYEPVRLPAITPQERLEAVIANVVQG